METLSLDQVERIRARFARARDLAAARFRESFAEQADLPPNERWRAHLEIQAATMLEALESVSLQGDQRITYFIDGRVIHPMVLSHSRPTVAHDPASALFPFFKLDRSVAALFEYWLLTSELLASAAWRLTRVIATAEEYNEALSGMAHPQLVKVMFVSYLPAGEFRQDGTAILEVTLYTRAGEERIERRQLLLDRNQELHFHARDLIAEGRAGVAL